MSAAAAGPNAQELDAASLCRGTRRHLERRAESGGRPLAPSGLPATHGIGDWRGRRLLYTTDEALELLANHELHVILLDLEHRIGRVVADREDRRHDRAVDRGWSELKERRVAAIVAAKSLLVATTVVRLKAVLKTMPKGGELTVAAVAEELGMHRGSLYRRPEYQIPVFAAMGRPPADGVLGKAAADPGYARVAHLLKAELVEEIKRARRRLKAEERAFAEVLDREVSGTSA
jgi:hypothetical protein